MLTWLSANGINIVILALVVLAAALAIRSLIRDKKAGRSSCGGDCASCQSACRRGGPEPPRPEKP